MATTIPSVADTAAFIDETLRGEIDPDGTGAYNSRPGSDNAALVSVLTKVATKAYAYAADRKKASITASAEAEDLDDHVRDVYFDARKAANAAVGTVYLQRSSGPLPPSTIDQGWRVGTVADGSQPAVEFEATASVGVPQGVTFVAVPVTCLQQGAIGNVNLSALTQQIDPLNDPSWTLYIPLPGDPVLAGQPGPDSIGGGADQEQDDDLKARILQRPAQAVPGTTAGVYKGATDVPGIASAVPIEIGDGTGLVYAGDINYQLPAALQQAVSINLDSWRPFGVPIGVRAMNVNLVQVSARVSMQRPLSNYNVSALNAAVVAAVLRYFTTERVHPDEYFLDAIKTAIGKANAETQSIALDSPLADVTRPDDSEYGTVLALNRYVVTAASISVQFFNPLTS